jgi:hypothetical protein
VLQTPTPTVLEVGSRQAPDFDHIGWLPDDCRYLGIDSVEGPNVDLVVDAHTLSEALPRRYFDAAFSLATFEQLAMPWVVAAELNRVLRTGALVYVAARHASPVDGRQADYFRFSEHSWAALFNRYSGFEVCAVASGEPARIVANAAHAAALGFDDRPAFLASAVLARKIGETDLRWDAPVAELVRRASGGNQG